MSFSLFKGKGKIIPGLIAIAGWIIIGFIIWRIFFTHPPATQKTNDITAPTLINFEAGGKITSDFKNLSDHANAAAIQTDGKIVIAGDTDNGTNFDFALARYNADGMLDTGFGSGGEVTTDFGVGGSETACCLTIAGDGKITVAGNYSPRGGDFRLVLARYKTDGTLDTTFGADGTGKIIAVSPLRSVEDFIVQPDGKIISTGRSGSGDFTLVRYKTDGSLDSSFGKQGQVTTDFGASNEASLVLGLQSDDKIVAAGYTYPASGADFALTRYKTDGKLDTGFGSGGKVTTDFGNSNDFGGLLRIQKNGKIVVAGTTEVVGSNRQNFALARYKTDGKLDTDFGSEGKVTTSLGSSDQGPAALDIEENGTILVGGYADIEGGDLDFAIAAYNSDGSLQNNFGKNGGLIAHLDKSENIIRGLAVQKDGKIIAIGTANNDKTGDDFALARFSKEGKVDTDFKKKE